MDAAGRPRWTIRGGQSEKTQMAICYQVSARGRLMCITGGRKLAPGEMTPTPAEALRAMLAGETTLINEHDVIPLHRLWWQAVTASLCLLRGKAQNTIDRNDLT